MAAPPPLQSWLDRLSRWQRWALAAWLLVMVLLCVRVALAPTVHNIYLIFANAAHNWLDGAPLYCPQPDGLDVFRYSPIVAAAFVPFAVLPDWLGSVLWRLLNAIVSLAALTWWGRATLPANLGRHRQLLLWLLVFPACVANINNGQSNPLVLALLLGAVAGVSEERWNLTAACIAGATLFKLYPLALGLLLLAVYPRRLSWRLGAALAVGVALPLVLQAPLYALGQYAEWVHYLRMDDRSTVALGLQSRDLRLVFSVWFWPLPAGAYQVLQVLSAVGAAALCLAARAQGWPRRRLLALATALGCCWMTILGPATESTTYLLLAPSLAAALLEGWRGGRPSRTFWVYTVASALLLAATASCWFPWGKAFGQLGPQPLAGLLMLGCLVTETLQELRRRRFAGPRADMEASPGPVPAPPQAA